MKRIITIFMCALSFSCFASSGQTPQHQPSLTTVCSGGPPVTDGQFCPQFKAIAQCHCMADGGLPAGMCTDMESIYQRMKAAFGSQEAACRWQEQHGSPVRTSAQECMNDWDCYRLGGDHGGICGGGKDGKGSKC